MYIVGTYESPMRPSNLPLPTSYSPLPCFKSPEGTFYFLLLTSNFLPPSWKAQWRLPISHSRHPTSDFLIPTSDFLLPTSYFRFSTSAFPHPTSHFRLHIFDFRIPTFGLPTSQFPPPTIDHVHTLTLDERIRKWEIGREKTGMRCRK